MWKTQTSESIMAMRRWGFRTILEIDLLFQHVLDVIDQKLKIEKCGTVAVFLVIKSAFDEDLMWLLQHADT